MPARHRWLQRVFPFSRSGPPVPLPFKAPAAEPATTPGTPSDCQRTHREISLRTHDRPLPWKVPQQVRVMIAGSPGAGGAPGDLQQSSPKSCSRSPGPTLLTGANGPATGRGPAQVSNRLLSTRLRPRRTPGCGACLPGTGVPRRCRQAPAPACSLRRPPDSGAGAPGSRRGRRGRGSSCPVPGPRPPPARQRARELRQGDGAVERHDRTGRDGQKLVIQLQDLRPVGVPGGRGVAVDGVDRRLELIRSRPVPAQAPAHQLPAFGGQGAVPVPPVLGREQHESAVGRESRGAAGLDEQHQRQQSRRFRFVRHQRRQQPAEPDGFRAELRTFRAVGGPAV